MHWPRIASGRRFSRSNQFLGPCIDVAVSTGQIHSSSSLENIRERVTVELDIQPLQTEIIDFAAHGFETFFADQ